MASFRIIEISNSNVDTRGANLLGIVMKYARSGDGDARETRRRALEKLGEYGYSDALLYIVDELAKSGDCDARETRRRALQLI